ncbi:ATP/GTP-binding protein [Streptomyces amakusaensis]|uniref:ATP/GTP-binding protein n=1 Tax=Streptomyces amakusaensis TaxID=67271 RepID=A0ABW0AN56_9ACTN
MAGEPTSPARAVMKILVTGGFGAGKTALIAAVSEITPVTTEAPVTEASAGTDSLNGRETKATTTVSFDFGRRTYPAPSMTVELFLFGTPGQKRFELLWEELARGAVGAVVLVDTRHLEDAFTPLDFTERHRLPVVIAVNEFAQDPHRYTAGEVRDALGVPPDVPVVTCDARDPDSARNVLATLLIRVRSQTHPSTPSASGALL